MTKSIEVNSATVLQIQLGPVTDPDNDRGGVITRSFLDGVDVTNTDDAEYVLEVSALERLVLAHACAGIDIEDPNYAKGVIATMYALAY